LPNPLIDLLSESLPLPGRAAAWEPAVDLVAVYNEKIATFGSDAGLDPVDASNIVLLWEWTRRGLYSDTTALYNLRKWNLHNALLTFHPFGGKPVPETLDREKVKRTLLVNSIASKRIKIECYPMIEADVLWALEHCPPTPKRPRGSEIKRKAVAAVKPYVLSMKGVREIYDILDRILNATGSLWFGGLLIGHALDFPPWPFEAADAFLAPLPPSLSAQDRFLKLVDALLALYASHAMSISADFALIRDLESWWNSGLLKTSQAADQFDVKYSLAADTILRKIVRKSRLKCQGPSSFMETLPSSHPLKFFARDIKTESRHLVERLQGEPVEFDPERGTAFQLGSTFLAEVEGDSVKRLGWRLEFDQSEFSYLLKILNGTCLVDPILKGVEDFSDFLSDIALVSADSRPLLKESVQEDFRWASELARTVLRNEEFNLGLHENLQKELLSIVSK
jgi:hypothetical protein